ncbi:MAG: SBBP repeat-containing protein [Leptospiraceae bacterium]|nr:SBBP repeat-containing protein [Leptospiraceae bacterium]MCP5501924.1 SBBP repeat-containing protein [Leptospiraceae bacterium]
MELKRIHIGFLFSILVFAGCLKDVPTRPSNELEALYKCKAGVDTQSCEKETPWWLFGLYQSQQSTVSESTYNNGSSITLTAGTAVKLNPPSHIDGSKYTVSPALPTGLDLDGNTGVISGTPTVTVASTQYTVTQTKPDSTSATFTFTIVVNASGSGGTGTGTGTTTASYAISGTISGLTASGLVLQNNSADDLTVAANATTFSFATKVSGAYSVTVKTQPSGLICTVSNGSGTATADVSNVSITCASSSWTKQIGVASKFTTGARITLDSNGNIYMTGNTSGALDGNTLTGSQDVFVIKYDSSGTKQWTKLMGSVSQFTAGTGIATDSTGNVYVTGNTTGALDGNTQTGIRDVFVIKYDSSGTKQWTKQMGVATKNTQGQSLTIDSSGNIYVTGETGGALDSQTLNGNQDGFIIKYDSSGTKQWTKLFGVAAKNIGPFGISADSGGNVYVTGTSDGTLDGETLTGTMDVFVTKYNSSGTRQWTKQMGITMATINGRDVSVDSSSNVYVTGYTEGGDLDGNTHIGTRDAFIIKYDSSGTKQWTKLFGVATKDTYGMRAATDSSGNIYISGNTTGGLDGNSLTGTGDAFVAKYNSSGIKQWIKQMGVASANTQANGIAVTSDGSSVYTGGYTQGGLDGNTLSGTTDAFLTNKLKQ